MIGPYRLPIHRHGAHMKIFPQSILILKSKFWPHIFGSLGGKGLIQIEAFYVM